MATKLDIKQISFAEQFVADGFKVCFLDHDFGNCFHVIALG